MQAQFLFLNQSPDFCSGFVDKMGKNSSKWMGKIFDIVTPVTESEGSQTFSKRNFQLS